MTPKLQTRIQRYGWDKAAPFYNDGWSDSLAPAQTCLLGMAKAQPSEHILDLASGTGLVTFPLAEAVGPQGRVVATDLSAGMIDTLRGEADQRGFTQVEAFRADAERLDDVEDGTFDLVTCALGLMYCPDPAKVMTETLRVLKPGGRAVFAVWGARKNCGWADIFPIVDARVTSDVCPLFFRLGTGQSLPHEMSRSGFEAIEMERINTILPYTDRKHALDAAFLAGPAAMAYARFDEATKHAVHTEYLQVIAKYKIKDGYEIPGEFVICAARKPL